MGRNVKFLLPLTIVMTMLWSSGSRAFFFGLPRALKYHLAKIDLDSPMLPPIGHSRFCLRYPDDCKVHGIDFRRRNIALTAEHWEELNSINRQINRDIVAKVTPGNGTFEEWLIAPQVGDCKNYAITKRHELLARGWPSRALLIRSDRPRRRTSLGFGGAHERRRFGAGQSRCQHTLGGDDLPRLSVGSR
jgi:predicted transglutaminase-like cysteine proteinase